jgi:hypothetical protein
MGISLSKKHTLLGEKYTNLDNSFNSMNSEVIKLLETNSQLIKENRRFKQQLINEGITTGHTLKLTKLHKSTLKQRLLDIQYEKINIQKHNKFLTDKRNLLSLKNENLRIMIENLHSEQKKGSLKNENLRIMIENLHSEQKKGSLKNENLRIIIDNLQIEQKKEKKRRLLLINRNNILLKQKKQKDSHQNDAWF